MARPAPPHSHLRGLRSPDADAARFALIERAAEWSLISQALGSTRAGSGSILLIHGPKGIGKTSLLSATRALAEETGMRVLTSRAHAAEREFSLSTLMQLFADAPVAFGNVGQEPGFDDLHRLQTLCRDLADSAGLALLVDDADLADEASLRCLLYLGERATELPLVLVLAAGTLGQASAPARLREIARHQNTTRCALQPLSLLGTQRRLAKTWPTLGDDVAAEIHEASGGNPFLVTAVAHGYAAENGTSAHTQVADWALATARAADDRAPAVLSALAVLGSGCAARHVCALTDVPLEEVLEVCDRLTDLGLLVDADPPRFSHPIVAAAIARAEPAGQRALKNLRAAECMAAEGASPERIAEYLMFAPPSGSGWVVETLQLAAASAVARAAPHDAVRFLRRALDEPPSPEHRAQLLVELGRVEAAAGDPKAADRLIGAVGQIGDMPADPEQALSAGRTLFALGRPEEALRIFDSALADAVESRSGIAGRLEAGRETARWLSAVWAGTGVDQVLVPESAETPGDRVLLALHSLHATFQGNQPRESVREAAKRALGGGALLEEETSDGVSYYLAAMALAYTEDLQAAERALTEALEDAQSRGSFLGFATASHMRAMAALLRGRLGDAALYARYAIAAERHGWRLGLSGARVVLANVCMERGDLESAGRHIAVAESSSGAADPFRLLILAARGRTELFSGDADAALESFLASGQIADSVGIRNPAVAPWRSEAGLATAVVGDWDEAERLIQAEIELARVFGAPGPIGRALRALAAIRPPADAIEILEPAVELLDAGEAELERAFAWVDYGAALRRAGRRRDALTPLREGLALAERCGAGALVSRAMREAHAAGARPRRAAIRGENALTAREAQVASLAADGLSNREIAEHLVVTIKTVEWHLRNAFLKLGVRSRKELAGKLAPGAQDTPRPE